MDNPDIADLKEELKEEDLDDEEISQCIEIIKDIYIGQNIRKDVEGILREDFFKFGNKINLLLKCNYIEEFQWNRYRHKLYCTTEKGFKIGKIAVTNLIEENKERIERFLSEQPQKVLNFIFQEHLLKEEAYHRYIYPVDANYITDLNWKDRLRKNDKIHRVWSSVLWTLENFGLCIRTPYYVSTDGGKLKEENYVISPEVFEFLVEHCPKEAFTPEEYDKIRVYAVLSYFAHLHSSDAFRNLLWDKLREVEEEKIKDVIDKMAETGITSKYRGFLGLESPFSIKDEIRYEDWLEKNLIEPVIGTLLELSKIGEEKDKAIKKEEKEVVKDTTDVKGVINLQIPPPSDLKILLGRDENNKEVFWEPDGTNEKPRMVSGNILITGGAGSGKTETLKSILYELNNRGYICLALGFHPDLRIDGFKFVQITAKSNIGLNPLDFDSLDEEGGGLPIQVYNVVERLKNTYPTIGDIQESNLIDIFEEAYKRKDITEDKETWKKPCPNFEAVEKILNEKISETSDKELLRLKNKLSKIFKFKIFSKSDTIDTKELFKESTILDVSKLPEDFLFLVSDTILRKIYRNLKLREPIEYGAKGKERFRIFIAIDEAKILVPSKKDDQRAIINIFGTEARKFGAGFIVSSQLTAHFGDDVLGNMATKIALKPLKYEIARDNAKELSIDPKALMNIENSGEGFIRFSNEKTKKVFIKSYEERKDK